MFAASIAMLLASAEKGDVSILATLLIGIAPTIVGVLMFRASLQRFRQQPPDAPPKSTIVE